MSQILENLYLGSYRDARDKTFLTSQQITHIVTVGAELKTLYPTKFDYLYIPAKDHFQFRLDDYFDEIADFIHKALFTDQGNVLVHCQKGVSRSTASVIAYLIKYHHMQLSEARSFVKSKRNIIFPNPGFMQQLNKYCEVMTAAKKVNKKSNEEISPKNQQCRNSRSVERKQGNEGIRTRFSISLAVPAKKDKLLKREENKTQYLCRSCQGNIFDGSNIIDDHHSKGIQDYPGMIYIQSASWMEDAEGLSSKIFCPNPGCKILLGIKSKNQVITDKCGIYSCRVAYAH